MKKGLLFLFFFGILLLGVGGFFLFFQQEPQETVQWEDLEVTDERVQTLYDIANPSSSILTLADTYKKGTFTNEFILGSAFVLYFKEKEEPPEIIPEEEITQKVHQIFGDITFAHDSGYIVSEYLCAFRYDMGSKSYTYLKGCDGSLNSYLSRKLVKAKKSDTEYILTEKLIYVKSNWDEVMGSEEKMATVKVYSDLNETKLIDTLSYDLETEEEPVISIENYLDQASTYEYHFVFDGENYIYRSLEKVN